MKKISPILLIIIILTLVGCARTWQFTPLESFRPADIVPPSSTCQTCHQGEYDSWKKTRHASETHMAPVPIKELRECGACHDNGAAHAADPAAKPGTFTGPVDQDRAEHALWKMSLQSGNFG